MQIRTTLLAPLFALVAASCGGEVEAKAHIPYVVATCSGPGDSSAVTHLKLHDDLGDLELWVYADEAKYPVRLPLETSPRITFFGGGVDGADRVVVLGPRDEITNPDENGRANIVDGRTHYFIFPREEAGGTEDAQWLRGTDFECEVQIEFDFEGGKWTTERFTLVPHTHGDDHAHDHDHSGDHADDHSAGESHDHGR